MEKVIDYLESQFDPEHVNIQRFREEVIEYDKYYPQERVWDQIGRFVDIAGRDNNKFLVLLEEQYKDLSSSLFNAQFGMLDDFKSSDNGSDYSEGYNDRDNQRREDNPGNYQERNFYNHDIRRLDMPNGEQYKARPKHIISESIYDEEDNDQDRAYLRANRYHSDEEDKWSDKDHSYDPLDTSKLKEPKSNTGANPTTKVSARIPHPLMNGMKPEFKYANPMVMIDPRVVTKGNLMQMMPQNGRIPMNMFSMMKLPQVNLRACLLNNGMGIPPMLPVGLPINQNFKPQVGPRHEKHQPYKKPEFGQNKQKSNLNSILVKNIPTEKNNIGDLNSYFTKFGEVTNVNLNTVKNTAVIKFSSVENARNAYMWKDPVLGIDSIQIVYNNGFQFQNLEEQPNGAAMPPVENAHKPFNGEDQAEFNQIQKKRNLKKQRKEQLNKEDAEFQKLLKTLKTDLTEEEEQEVKKKLADVKASICQILKEEKNDKLEEIEAKKKATGNKKYVSEKLLQKQNVSKAIPAKPKKLFEIVLKITDQSLVKKWGKVLEKLKPLSSKITDWKLIGDEQVKVKLLHNDMDTFKQDLQKLNAFEFQEAKVQGEEKKRPDHRFQGYY